MSDQDELEIDEVKKQLYVKGFNAGYLLEKEISALLGAVLDGDKRAENPYFDGLKAGSKEMKREKYLEEAKELQKKSKSKDRDR